MFTNLVSGSVNNENAVSFQEVGYCFRVKYQPTGWIGQILSDKHSLHKQQQTDHIAKSYTNVVIPKWYY